MKKIPVSKSSPNSTVKIPQRRGGDRDEIGDNLKNKISANGRKVKKIIKSSKKVKQDARATDEYNTLETNGNYIDTWISLKKYRKWLKNIVGGLNNACQRKRKQKTVPKIEEEGIYRVDTCPPAYKPEVTKQKISY